jgi:hypothetical protein
MTVRSISQPSSFRPGRVSTGGSSERPSTAVAQLDVRTFRDTVGGAGEASRVLLVRIAVGYRAAYRAGPAKLGRPRAGPECQHLRARADKPTGGTGGRRDRLRSYMVQQLGKYREPAPGETSILPLNTTGTTCRKSAIPTEIQHY